MLSPAMPEPNAESFRDRSTALAVFGAAHILIGLGCAALIPLTLVGVSISPAMEAGIVVPSLVLYATGAAIFVTLGIGSIRTRRWAQTLSLSLGIVWLITGVCTMALLWVAAPSLWHDIGAGAGLDSGTIRMVTIVINLVLTVLYVLLPGAIVLFYRSPAVVATCHRRDPEPGWAGRCPQKLLSLAVAYALCALSIVAMPSYNFVFPLFGLVLSGTAGACIWALVLVFCLALSWGTCRREFWALWAAIGGCVFAAISSVATFSLVKPAALFEAMDLHPDQLMILEQFWPENPWIHVALWLAIWGSLALYLVTVRGLFGNSSDSNSDQ
jgi:hypothetical protein